MSGTKNKTLIRNKYNTYFQHGLKKAGKTSDWRDWFNSTEKKKNAINTINNKSKTN